MKTPGSGRQKGTRNKKTEDLQALLDRMKCDPREAMARIIQNDLPCGVCRGKGKTPYLLPARPGNVCVQCRYGTRTPEAVPYFTVCPECGYEEARKIEQRECQSCKGTLMEACSPALRGNMAAELLQYLLPKRKAIEVSGSLGLDHTVSLAAVLAGRREKRSNAEPSDS